jgi:hypothetical protein
MQTQVLTTKKLKQFLSADPYSFKYVNQSETSVNETDSSLSNASAESRIYNFGLRIFLNNPYAA